eukprot:GILK01010199.1.p1 GENE.GILK01010199.1~~GILK01010199.1.p1  ORF type:complete len:354 (+),score=34.20 GILK01010199.1:82-1143(+)
MRSTARWGLCIFKTVSPLYRPTTKSRVSMSFHTTIHNSPHIPLLVVSTDNDRACQLASRFPLDRYTVTMTTPEYASADATFQTDFDFKRFFNGLSTQSLGRLLLHSAVLPSTQTLLNDHCDEFQHGVVCLADSQSSGRGRGSNVWESPAGSLCFSFKCAIPTTSDEPPLLQYLVPLAFVESIDEKVEFKSAGLRIKWPNDVYGAGVKLGGVLVQSSYASTQKFFDVTVGFGININNEHPTTSLKSILSSPTPLSREDILSSFLNKFEAMFSIFVSDGFAPFKDLYLSRWLHTNQRVIIQEEKGDTPLVIKGITNQGYLLAVTETNDRRDSEIYELHPDGNRLDFFKGLIRKKI